jgi:hypothetical protein
MIFIRRLTRTFPTVEEASPRPMEIVKHGVIAARSVQAKYK